MAERILKLLGFGRRNSDKNDDLEAPEDVEEAHNKEKSLVVALLKSKQKEKLVRKKSSSECCLDEQRSRSHGARAPLCGAESNLTMGSEGSAVTIPGVSSQVSDSSQSVAMGQGKAGARVNIDKSLLRETQSCELLVSVNNGKNVKHDIVRKTVSVASAARIKDDTNILRNIKKREVVNALKGNTKSLSLGGLSGLSKAGLSSKLNFTMSVSDKYEPSWKDSQFISELLDWHNLLRARHGVKQLQLDNSLCKMAQNWANFLAHTNEFHYQNPKEYGENLLLWPLPVLPPSSLAKKSPDVTGRYVATYWYRSHFSFPYHADPDVMQSYASAFTQMVWAGSQNFGCGKARSSNGKVIVVAYYHPKGNIPDKYHLNVVQPRETFEQ